MAFRKTEGADPSVIYEDRHLEVMNKRPVAETKQRAYLLQESGVPAFLRHEVMNRLSQSKYVFLVSSLSSPDKRFTRRSDATEVFQEKEKKINN